MDPKIEIATAINRYAENQRHRLSGPGQRSNILVGRCRDGRTRVMAVGANPSRRRVVNWEVGRQL